MMATEKRGEWCAFPGHGQWNCDDAPCENAAGFHVAATVIPSDPPVLRHGDAATPRRQVSLDTCVRHVGYAATVLLHHGEVRVEWIDHDGGGYDLP